MADAAAGKQVYEARVAIGLNVSQEGGNVRRAIDSVVAQNIEDWELVIFDDTPSGTVAELAASYGDERISVRRTVGYCGLASALCELLVETTAPYVAVLGENDVIFADHLGRMCTLLEAYPRSVVAHGAYERWDRAGNRQAVVAEGATRPFEETGRAFIRRAAADPARLWWSSALLRRSSLTQSSPRVEDGPAAELLAWLRIARHGTVLYDPVPSAACAASSPLNSTLGDVLAVPGDSFQPTLTTVRSYEMAVRSFAEEAALGRCDRARLALLRVRTTRRMLASVVRRRVAEERDLHERLDVLRRAAKLQPAFLGHPVFWRLATEVTFDTVSRRVRATAHEVGDGTDRAMIDLTGEVRREPAHAASPLSAADISADSRRALQRQHA